MNRTEVEKLTKQFTKGTGSGKPKPKPDLQRNDEPFWRNPNKHKRDLDRDNDLLKVYVQVATRCGSSWMGAGIKLRDGFYLVCDKAVMNSALNRELVSFAAGTFRMEEKGWKLLFG